MAKKYQSVYFRLAGIRGSKWLPNRSKIKIYELKIGDTLSKLVTFEELVQEIDLADNDLYSCVTQAETFYNSGRYDLWVNYPGGEPCRIN